MPKTWIKNAVQEFHFSITDLSNSVADPDPAFPLDAVRIQLPTVMQMRIRIKFLRILWIWIRNTDRLYERKTCPGSSKFFDGFLTNELNSEKVKALQICVSMF